MRTYRYQVVIEQDEDGVFVAEIPSIRACYAQGATFEEAVSNIRDVLRMCIEEMQARGEDVPPPTEVVGLKRVEVAV